MPRFADHLVSTADILLSKVVDGEVRVNLGDLAGDAEGVGSDVAMWGLPGFYSVPDLPDAATGAAQALYLVDGQAKRVIAARDNRQAPKAGTAPPGARGITTRGEARVMLNPDEDAVTAYTANQEDDDASQMIDLRGKNGVTLILNGGCMIRQKTDELAIAIVDGPTFLMDGDGFQFSGKKFVVLCSTVTLGLNPGGVPPPPGLNSAIVGTTGMSGIPSSSVTIAS